jgi:hypothetical protein
VVGISAAIYFLAATEPATDRPTENVEIFGTPISTLDDAEAILELSNSVRSAKTYLAENDTFIGFSPVVASGLEPGIAFDAMPVSSVGVVSIRSVTDATLLLVTKSGEGGFFCAAFEGDTVSYGRVEATHPEDCTGGWRE